MLWLFYGVEIMANLSNIAFTNVPASIAASDAAEAGHLRAKTVYLKGGGTWTADVEVSDDGVAWAVAAGGASKASGAVVTVSETCKAIRINVTAYTSGTPAASLLGEP